MGSPGHGKNTLAMTALPGIDESARLAALQEYEILDTAAEPDFDELTRLAARICQTPMALVTLLDRDRQWFKARVGLDLAETPREIAFCNHAIQQSDVFIVPDAAADARFSANPLVTGDPGVRFYAGTPLITPQGHPLGTLCVIDTVPRELAPEAREVLRGLGRQVMAQLELRRTARELLRRSEENRATEHALRSSEALKTRIIESSRDCIKLLDLEGNLISMNAGGMQMLEICDLAPFVGSSWADFWQGEDRNAALAAIETARNGGVGRFVGYFETLETHRPMWFDVAVSALSPGDGQPDRLLALSRDVTARKQAEAKLRALAEGTARETGTAFFRSLAQHLAQGLSAEYAFVAECTDATKTQVRTLAFWKAEGFLDDISFALTGTPCEHVIAGEKCIHRENLQQLFPKDVGLVAMQAESYFGIPLKGRDGAILGHIAVIDVRPMMPSADDIALLEIFAARAGAELERQRADRALRLALEEVEALKNRLQAENVYLQEEIRSHHGFEAIVGKSPAHLKVLDGIAQVAPTSATVLIRGETGTGKELVARAIHARSNRAARPFIALNCGAISAGLVESELFGHERGAFTGATARKVGRFELAEGGTIFLDEIGDLQPDLQVKLLRVLQEGEFERVGGTKPIRVDTRVIAATHCDLEQLVKEDRFRADLFYRLDVFPIRTPPLRDRKEDIPLLVRHLVHQHATKLGKAITIIPTEVMTRLCAYPWPGNIRELSNVIECSVILSSGPGLELGDWMATSRAAAPDSLSFNLTPPRLDEMERHHILEALERTGWKVSGPAGAAAALGLKPTTLESRMKKHGIRRPN
ncbi:MAG TPA: sigma 54-interacting transcriptional regulator [Gemmatimonadales bacterium]|nr:sigma 54-interacting transcriptional regulator [Gemmatimonadales bacterium]